MSILIEGMEMPKNCEIIIRIDEKGEVYVYDQYPTKIYKAIPVPPHGRLIDADLFSKVLKGRAAEEWNQHISPLSWSYAYECLIDTVGLTPTVIPADKDGET